MSFPDNGTATIMLDRLWDISRRLKSAQIWHECKVYRFDGISILAHVPGQYWEIDILDDGTIDLEIYRSDGLSDNPSETIDTLIDKWAEPLPHSKGE